MSTAFCTAHEAEDGLTAEERSLLERLESVIDEQISLWPADDHRRHHHLGGKITARLGRHIGERYRRQGWSTARVSALPSGAHLLILER